MAHPIVGLVQIEDGSRWMRMTDPAHIVDARRPTEVAAALRAVQTQVRARGGYALGFLTYEAGQAFGLAASPGASTLPLAWFAVFDPANVQPVERPAVAGSYTLGPGTPSVSREQFVQMLRTVRERIACGDTYQVNCTFRLRRAFSGDPLSLFADLTAAQGGRYGAFLRWGDRAICSASPELFFSRQPDGLVVMRPMKGTTRRGRTVEEDAERAAELRASLKERAENVMVVDMARNDVGRVARYGSVEVPDLFTLERYPNVWQMTSTVTARTDAPLDEIVAAAFPSASVTGAPKVRTMEIIASLEREPRGVYTGSMVYLAPDGSAQLNVAIRTAEIDLAAAQLDFGVGSGVVWDSDPEKEYEECLLKGSILGERPRPFELLETMRWTPAGGVDLYERHLARLAASARHFGFRCSLADVRAAVERAVIHSSQPLRLRLLANERGEARVECAPLPEGPATWRVRLAEHPVDRGDPFLFHKTTNRAVYDRARRPDCDDVILWNEAGQVTESTIANVVVEIEGRRVTPPVASGLLAGTFRAELLAAGEVVERAVTVAELRSASAIWLVNSVRGWCPASLVG